MNPRNFLFIFALVLVSVCLHGTNADPEPEPAKNHHRAAYFNEPANPRFRSAAIPDDINEPVVAEFRQADGAAAANDDTDASDPVKTDASSGRLFLRKFLLFKNLFGSSSTQPVIPIIITGNGNTATAAPTTTITSTGSIPSATGIITTSPVTTTASRIRSDRDDNGEEEEAGVGETAAVDVQALQAALAANAQEYVVTDQEIKGTSDSKATKQPDSINLRRKGAKKGQFISIRIPPQYRRYFKNGQKVMLNGQNNRVGNRRVVKKRVNKNRRRVVNKNKRNRLVPVA